jgi:predicted  nucleic acid-binding Zn-ribbon protein
MKNQLFRSINYHHYFMRKIFLLLSLFSITTVAGIAQSTAGIAQVQQIESKAAEYLRSMSRLESLNNKLSGLENDKRLKLQQLQNELAEMKKQRDAEISDLKGGFFCSQCNVMKSEMEKKGENFEDHLKRVKGYPVPAPDATIAAKRQAWTEKIALKTVETNNFNARDFNGMAALKKEIETLKAALAKICPEIYGLSQQYEQKVVAEGKQLQGSWIDPAMRAAANEHIALDKVIIAQGRITAMEKQFREKSEALRTKIKEETTAKQETLKADVNNYKAVIQTLKNDLESEVQVIETAMSPKTMRRSQLNSDMNVARTDSLRKLIAAELRGIIAEITGMEQKQKTTEASFNTRIKEREAAIKKADDEIWALTTGLTKKQEDGVAELKKQFDISINALRNSKKNYETLVPAAHTAFLTAAAEARKKLTEYVGAIESENRRMYAAANPIKCTVLTAAQLTVSSNFNTEAQCMEGLRNRDRSFPSTGMDCAAKSEAYTSVYRSFLSTLIAEDIQYIKAGTGSYWSESIFK